MTAPSSIPQPLSEDMVYRIVEASTSALRTEIANLKEELEKFTVNTVTEYSQQTIDEGITCDETLDIIKSLPVFGGKDGTYVSWREAAHNSMFLYRKGSRRYFAALTILRNKIVNDANDVLTNHGTVLNFDAIISRLDFAYADKRPIHIIEQELSIMRQGNLSLLDFYNEVNKKLTLLINKTIMTHGTNTSLSNELNNKNRQYALRVFITGLNSPLNDILFSISPTDLPNALAKAQELQANHVRANFAQQFFKLNPNNSNPKVQNNLRFQRPHQINQSDNRHNNNNNQIERGQHFSNQSNLNQPITNQRPEPMETDLSAQRASNSQNYYNRNTSHFQRYPMNQRQYPQNNFQQAQKRPPNSGQISNQPQYKAQRVNNLNEDTFLEENPGFHSSPNEEVPEDHIRF